MTGASDGSDRACKDTETGLGERGLGGVMCQTTGTASAPITRIATGPSSLGVGTGVVTGTGNGLDWILSDGDDDVEGTATQRRRATSECARVQVLERQTAGVVGATGIGLGQANLVASTVAMASVTADTTAATPPADTGVMATASAAAAAPNQLSSAELLQRMNEVCVRAAKTTIPPEERTTVARRMRPSVQSRQFAEARAVEMAAGVTLQRKKELHQQMRRLRRKDYQQWQVDCIKQLNQCVLECRWRDVRKWKDALRGV